MINWKVRQIKCKKMRQIICEIRLVLCLIFMYDNVLYPTPFNSRFGNKVTSFPNINSFFKEAIEHAAKRFFGVPAFAAPDN